MMAVFSSTLAMCHSMPGVILVAAVTGSTDGLRLHPTTETQQIALSHQLTQTVQYKYIYIYLHEGDGES